MKTIANKKDLISEGIERQLLPFLEPGSRKFHSRNLKEKSRFIFLSKRRHIRMHKRIYRIQWVKDKFARAGTVVIGLSPDPVVKHVKFQEKYNLSQPLASDESKETLLAYGVWIENRCMAANIWASKDPPFLLMKKEKSPKYGVKLRCLGTPKRS